MILSPILAITGVSERALRFVSPAMVFVMELGMWQNQSASALGSIRFDSITYVVIAHISTICNPGIFLSASSRYR